MIEINLIIEEIIDTIFYFFVENNRKMCCQFGTRCTQRLLVVAGVQHRVSQVQQSVRSTMFFADGIFPPFSWLSVHSFSFSKVVNSMAALFQQRFRSTGMITAFET